MIYAPATTTLLLVGNPSEEHVGAHLRAAADELGVHCEFADVNSAYAGSTLARRINWWLRGRRPNRLRAFSSAVAEQCETGRTALFLTTGIAPVSAEALKHIAASGTITANFLTDDPWNSAHRAPWFLDALPLYHFVFSPRTANMEQLRAIGCASVEFVRFGYAPHLHFREAVGEPRAMADVFFAGGADADRHSWIEALIADGYSLHLYGGYWERNSRTRPFARGIVPPAVLRQAVASSRISLCLVRKANRDGHAMRTFELAAMGACMLVEWTEDHQDLFGKEGERVWYFRSLPEMRQKTAALLANTEERVRLASALHRWVVSGGHTYRHRLTSMLACMTSLRTPA